jgi:hypothetical protein
MARSIGFRTRLAVWLSFIVAVCAVGPANADFTFGTPTNFGAPINSSYGESGVGMEVETYGS